MDGVDDIRGGGLIRVHRIITRALKVSLDKAKKLQHSKFTSDMVQEGYLLYLNNVVDILRVHLRGEDQVAFPYLKFNRVAAAYDELEMDHRALNAFLYDIEISVRKITAGENENVFTMLQDALSRIIAIWHPHIAKEEMDLLPTAFQQISGEEENELNALLWRHAQENGGPSYLRIPFSLYNLSSEDRRMFAKDLSPEVINTLIPGPWKEKWEAMQPFLLD